MASVHLFEGDELADADLAALHGAVAAALAVDRPGDPVPTVAEFADRLRHRRGGRRTFRWLARADGVPVGHLVLALPDRDNTHLGLVDLAVHPDARRRGAGSALLREAARTAAANGRRSLLLEAYAGTAGAAFTAALGLRAVHEERISILRLADVDRSDIERLAAAAHPGYRLERWVGAVPDALLNRFATAKSTMNEAPTGDMDWSGVLFTPTAIRDEEAMMQALGREWRVVVAVHEASGDVAALTELAVPRDPRRCDQEDTAVVPAHRGSGLGLWVKAALLGQLRAERPAVAEIVTGNAEDNGHMLRINTRLGFRPFRVLHEWQADVPALVDRLSGQPA